MKRITEDHKVRKGKGEFNYLIMSKVKENEVSQDTGLEFFLFNDFCCRILNHTEGKVQAESNSRLAKVGKVG